MHTKFLVGNVNSAPVSAPGLGNSYIVVTIPCSDSSIINATFFLDRAMPSRYAILNLDDAPAWEVVTETLIRDAFSSAAEPGYEEESWAYYETAKTGKLPACLVSYDGIVLSGSHYNLSEPETHHLPFVRDTMALVRTGVERGSPRLVGICFAHHLLALALGGKVTRHPLGRFAFEGRGHLPLRRF